MLVKRASRITSWTPVVAGLLAGFVIASSLDGIKGYLGCRWVQLPEELAAKRSKAWRGEGWGYLPQGWTSPSPAITPSALPPFQHLSLQVERMRGDYLRVVRDSLTGAALRIPAHQPRSKQADPSKLVFRDFRPDLRHLGLDWPRFGYTLSGTLRLENIQALLETALSEGIPGGFVECGVWRGGSSIYAAAVLHAHGVTDRDVHLVDSFKSPSNDSKPKPSVSEEEYLGVALPQVVESFRSFGLLGPRVHFHQGYFRYSLPQWRGGDRSPIAVLRLGSGTSWEDTMDQLYNLWDDVAPGGFILLDDYGAQPSTSQAVHAFLHRQDIQVAIEDVDGSGAWFRKPYGTHRLNHAWYTAWNSTNNREQGEAN